MERLFITGVDGVVGGNLAVTLADRFEVVGVCHRQEIEIEGCRTVYCDASDTRALTGLLEECDPQWVVHCGAVSRSSWESCDCASLAADLDIVKVLQSFCVATRRLTVVLSDAVFAGPRMFHDENSPANAQGYRADLARQVEALLASTGALAVRTHVFGWSPTPDDACWVERAASAMADGLYCEADTEKHATPLLASDLAELLARAYERNLAGMYHMGGAESTTPFRFAAGMAGTFGYLGRQVRRIEPQPAHADTATQETSLNSNRARNALGMPMPMLREGLNRFCEQAANGYRDRLQVSQLAAGSWLRASA